MTTTPLTTEAVARERSLEDRAFDAIAEWASRESGDGAVGSARLSLILKTFGALARRDGMRAGVSPHSQTPEERFRLPASTIRKLREETDPEPGCQDVRWRWDETRALPEVTSKGLREWHREHAYTPTKRRRALWDDLERRIYHEEVVEVDPAEVLP